MGRGPGGRKAAFFVEKQQIKQTYTDPLVLGFRMVWTEVPLSSVGGSFGRPPEPCLEAPFIIIDWKEILPYKPKEWHPQCSALSMVGKPRTDSRAKVEERL